MLVTALSISLLHVPADAMSKTVSDFLTGTKKFLSPYQVIEHTYKMADDGISRGRYSLAGASDEVVVEDDMGTKFKAEKKYFFERYKRLTAIPQPNDGAFFVEKSSATKIKEKENDYNIQTTTLDLSPDTSLKGIRVFYRDNLGRYKLSFILNYPRIATSLKYGALMSAIYGGYSWFKSKSKKPLERTDAQNETEFEGEMSS